MLEACEQLESAIDAYKKALKNGVDRADQNVRNCTAKLLSARLDVQRQQKEIDAKKAAKADK